MAAKCPEPVEPPQQPADDEPIIDCGPPTEEESRRAEELVRKYGWEHLRVRKPQ